MNRRYLEAVRKALISIAILVALIGAIAGGWIFAGRQVSLFFDRFGTVENSLVPIQSIRYEGNGTGGLLRVGELGLSLNPNPGQTPPTVGSTKDGQVALAFSGKVFPFGPLPRNNDEDVLVTSPPTGDEASISTRYSALSWPTPFDFNFMTGHSPSWKRHRYQRLIWKKSNGPKLDMLWRYEQYFYPPDGWTDGSMTREGSTGLIHIDIQP
ncbi:MAG: hypothetical protein JWO45_1754 [Spartobacteria bacterium]|nr:hypothetical protein [Spartobacteria bacterium]